MIKGNSSKTGEERREFLEGREREEKDGWLGFVFGEVTCEEKKQRGWQTADLHNFVVQ